MLPDFNIGIVSVATSVTARFFGLDSVRFNCVRSAAKSGCFRGFVFDPG